MEGERDCYLNKRDLPPLLGFLSSPGRVPPWSARTRDAGYGIPVSLVAFVIGSNQLNFEYSVYCPSAIVSLGQNFCVLWVFFALSIVLHPIL